MVPLGLGVVPCGGHTHLKTLLSACKRKELVYFYAVKLCRSPKVMMSMNQVFSVLNEQRLECVMLASETR